MYFKINLEKKEERWWDRLFLSDPPINTSKIDTTMMASDLGQEEHMKIAELMANQERRQQFTAVTFVYLFSHLFQTSHLQLNYKLAIYF